MGSLGRTGIPGFLIGNTAEKVLRHGGPSIIAVKPDRFVSPVRAK
jgi:nucleotide-binding universal stress UspA family protein